ncbi:glycosyl transferase [Kosakonia radicincitans DSM 16656]|uniref:ADP-heptose:LPS heptosyltransferase n=1 Tax=Kosakonia radicincitans TaxID=283686 RepID=A0AAX2EWE7_9ENTR|nr:MULTISPECIES: glycosyltransferase family 9 protein [Kosakonia]MDP9568784.1 ADP-heptose:LPS heptosyltransferase [Kosakonia oryzae]ARD61202.1 glycosyl transferase [Kosakonia radicincitans DSM 16656]KDE37086.1 glycosyl transferase [Kosakonia radicincitans UMEnt01/12]NCF03900.1 lipopolysaccharide heptosyltransferase family protein [Kosakonia sp. MH5]PTA92907.1 lipopolysaccharide heptosyltransferase family protein [Kosakonia sp. H7A]
MMQHTAIEMPVGKFKKLRALNRRRNYLIKKIRMLLRIYIAKMLWDSPARSELNLISARKVLLMRNEGAIGDVVVDSALVKCLHESGYIVDFLLTKSNSQVMRYNPRIRHIYEAEDVTSASYLKKFTHNVPRSVITELASNKYDIVIDPSLFDIPVHRLLLLRQINAKAVLGFNKWPSINHYTKSFDFDCANLHVSKTFSCIADCMQLDKKQLETYDLHIPQDIYAETQQFLAAIEGRKIIINIFAGNEDRCLSQTQLAVIIEQLQIAYPAVNIILLDHRKEIHLPLPDKVVINPFKTLHHAMALIAQADLIISPDTSIVHMAAAWQKPLIAIYKDVRLNNQLWAPGYENARQIIIKCGKVHQKQDIASLIMAEIDPARLR